MDKSHEAMKAMTAREFIYLALGVFNQLVLLVWSLT